MVGIEVFEVRFEFRLHLPAVALVVAESVVVAAQQQEQDANVLLVEWEFAPSLASEIPLVDWQLQDFAG